MFGVKHPSEWACGALTFIFINREETIINKSPVGSVVKRVTSNDKITGSIPVRGKWLETFFLLAFAI